MTGGLREHNRKTARRLQQTTGTLQPDHWKTRGCRTKASKIEGESLNRQLECVGCWDPEAAAVKPKIEVWVPFVAS